MLTMDTLTCEILPNAIGNDSLSCSMPPLEYLQLWSTIGSLAAALFALVLAAFAFMAWREQKRTLAKMEEQIVATARQGVDSRQVQFLADYVKALRTAGERCDRKGVNMSDLGAAATEAWMVWSMELMKSDPRMREVTQWWEGHFAEQMHDFRQRRSDIEGWDKAPLSDGTTWTDADQYTTDRDDFYRSLGNYIGNLQRWQVDERERSRILNLLDKRMMDIEGSRPEPIAKRPGHP